MMGRLIGLLLAAGLVAGPAVPPRDPGGTLVLRGATLLDGTGSPPKPDAVVVVRDGRILSVGRSMPKIDTESGAPPPREVDLTGRWIVPGLIDMHAHVTILPAGPDGTLRHHYDRAASEQVLRIFLAMGVTTVRNPAAPSADGVELREAVASGRIPGPRIFTAGDSIGTPMQHPSAPAVGVATPEQARREVDRQARAGVDFIKLYASLPPPLVRAVIEEAHARGLKVIGHLQATSWTEAARAGIDFITHGASWSADLLPPGRRAAYRTLGNGMRARIDWLEWLDADGPEVREMVSTLRHRRIPVDPTLVAYHTKFWGDDPTYLEAPDLAIVPAVVRAVWAPGWLGWEARDFARARAAWPRIERLVRLYHERGVPLLAGSDTPNPWVVPGAGFHKELELLVHAGIPPLEVLSIATAGGARALGLGAEAGTIEPGKTADMVVLTADPLVSITNTRSIEWVLKGGIMIRPAELTAWSR